MRRLVLQGLALLGVALLAAGNGHAADATPGDGRNIATMRDGTGIDEPTFPPPMGKVENEDLRRARAYPMQPPTIPHAIDGYRVDRNSNKCLACHSRTRTAESQAPMVSVTHFMDRDGNFLAAVSPRRYFCQQCHVTQERVTPPVRNTFEDVDAVVARLRGNTK